MPSSGKYRERISTEMAQRPRYVDATATRLSERLIAAQLTFGYNLINM